MARDLGVRKGLVNGIGMGLMWLIIFGSYALGFWYGTELTIKEPEIYTVGNMIIVSFYDFLIYSGIYEY